MLFSVFCCRENILKVNGSHIRDWWIVHHYVSSIMSIAVLTCEFLTVFSFVPLFLSFYIIRCLSSSRPVNSLRRALFLTVLPRVVDMLCSRFLCRGPFFYVYCSPLIYFLAGPADSKSWTNFTPLLTAYFMYQGFVQVRKKPLQLASTYITSCAGLCSGAM